jgi:hypothetical protein
MKKTLFLFLIWGNCIAQPESDSVLYKRLIQFDLTDAFGNVLYNNDVVKTYLLNNSRIISFTYKQQFKPRLRWTAGFSYGIPEERSKHHTNNNFNAFIGERHETLYKWWPLYKAKAGIEYFKHKRKWTKYAGADLFLQGTTYQFGSNISTYEIDANGSFINSIGYTDVFKRRTNVRGIGLALYAGGEYHLSARIALSGEIYINSSINSIVEKYDTYSPDESRVIYKNVRWFSQFRPKIGLNYYFR